MSSSHRVVIALCGLLGIAALGVYYSVPVPMPSPGADMQAIGAFVNGNRERILMDAWLQATGSLLAVIFFLAVIHLAGGLSTFGGWIGALGSTTVLAMTFLDVALVIGATQGAAADHLTTTVTCFDLTFVFVHIFPIGPAPATFLGLGMVLLTSSVLPRPFAYSALSLALAFEILGFLGLFWPVVTAAIILLLVLQELWIGAAAIYLLTQSVSLRDRKNSSGVA